MELAHLSPQGKASQELAHLSSQGKGSQDLAHREKGENY